MIEIDWWLVIKFIALAQIGAVIFYVLRYFFSDHDDEDTK